MLFELVAFPSMQLRLKLRYEIKICSSQMLRNSKLFNNNIPVIFLFKIGNMISLLEVPNSLGWWWRDCRMMSSDVLVLTSKLGRINPIPWGSKIKFEAELRLTPSGSPSYTCRHDICSVSYLPMVCHIPFSQTVLVFCILNINSSGQGLPLVTAFSTVFSGTAN